MFKHPRAQVPPFKSNHRSKSTKGGQGSLPPDRRMKLGGRRRSVSSSLVRRLPMTKKTACIVNGLRAMPPIIESCSLIGGRERMKGSSLDYFLCCLGNDIPDKVVSKSRSNSSLPHGVEWKFEKTLFLTEAPIAGISRNKDDKSSVVYQRDQSYDRCGEWPFLDFITNLRSRPQH